MTKTLEELNFIAAHKYKLPDLTQFIADIIIAYEREQQSTNFIDVQYTDDEYGAAAKKLGLIKHAYAGDAGIDLPTILPISDREKGLTIFPGDRIMLQTGLRMAFPKGYWGRIIHRSSTEKAYRLRVIEGVIDDYRGPLLVQVHNMNSFPIQVLHGQRMAQLILAKTASFNAREVDNLPPSERGTNGFGSSGTSAHHK